MRRIREMNARLVKSFQGEEGFTLVELLITTVIIGFMTCMASGGYVMDCVIQAMQDIFGG